MKAMDYGMIDVSSLVVEEYTDSRIKAMAEAMIAAGGAAMPVIVIEAGLVNGEMMHKVIGNHTVAQAARVARQLQPRAFEMISAMIIGKGDTATLAAVEAQMKIAYGF